jgi:hypothetical protein
MRHNGMAWKIMRVLSMAYGVTIVILAALHGPVGSFAWIGAIALGLGWGFSEIFSRQDRQYRQDRRGRRDRDRRDRRDAAED